MPVLEAANETLAQVFFVHVVRRDCVEKVTRLVAKEAGCLRCCVVNEGPLFFDVDSGFHGVWEFFEDDLQRGGGG